MNIESNIELTLHQQFELAKFERDIEKIPFSHCKDIYKESLILLSINENILKDVMNNSFINQKSFDLGIEQSFSIRKIDYMDLEENELKNLILNTMKTIFHYKNLFIKYIQ